MLGTKVLSVHGVGDPNGPGLEILETAQGGPKDEQGEVVFVARFRDKEGLRSHHERGQFKRKRGRWLFTEGIMARIAPAEKTRLSCWQNRWGTITRIRSSMGKDRSGGMFRC